MPVPSASHAAMHAATVTRLRAAGCVFAEDEADLLLAEARDVDELAVMTAARVAGTPLEHVVGWAAFCGLRIAVEPRVFVPRRRTELMVREALALATSTAVVVDLCCGSGAIGAAVADGLPGVELHAADVDPVAVACARRNVEPRGGRVHEGDLDAALPERLRGRVELLLVNAPYVPTDAIASMPPEARTHEERVALDGGADGLDVHRRVALAAPCWLAPAGHVLIETSERQSARTASLLEAAGFVVRTVRDDDLDATVAVGTSG